MGEGLSVPLPPYLSPPYFAMLSGSLSSSPRPALAGACGEVGLLGPPLFRPGEESPGRAHSQSRTIGKKKKKKEKKNLEPLLH